MSRIKTFIALLVLCAADGVAQKSADSQSQIQPTPPRMIRVAVGVMLGFVERRAVPEYPDQALTKGIEGDVIFKIVIDQTGRILFSVPVEGDSLLVAASTNALRDFRCAPTC